MNRNELRVQAKSDQAWAAVGEHYCAIRDECEDMPDGVVKMALLVVLAEIHIRAAQCDTPDESC